MNSINNVKLVSTYRLTLMGLAMLLVIMHHQIFITYPCRFLTSCYGMLGVDIFLIVSGFSIFHSLNKHKEETTGPFYRRRLLRIMPAAIIAGALLAYHFAPEVADLGGPLLNKILCLTGLNQWYVRSLILLYIAAPFLLRYYDKHQASYRSFLLLSAVVIVLTMVLHRILICCCPCIYHPLNETVTWTLSRFHAFALGMFLTMRAYRGAEENGKAWLAVTLCISLPAILLFMLCMFGKYKYHYYTAILCFPTILPFLICLMLGICHIARHIPEKVLAPINWFGKYSLEVFLIHMSIFTMFASFKSQVNGYVLLATGIALSCLLAWLLHWVCAKITARLESGPPAAGNIS